MSVLARMVADVGRLPMAKLAQSLTSARHLSLFVFALLFLLSNLPAAEPAPVEFLSCRIGFDGRYKVGLWTQAAVRVRRPESNTAVEGRVELTTLDGDGVAATYVSSPIAIDVKGVEVVFPCRFGRHDGVYELAFRAQDGEVLGQRRIQGAEPSEAFPPRRPVASQHEVLLCVGGSLGLEDLEPTTHRPVGRYVVELPDDSQAPIGWEGYDGVDAVILLTSQPDNLGRLLLAGENNLWRSALDGWVRRGGRLTVCLGDVERAANLAGREGPLASLLPAAYADDHVRLPLLREWETFADSKAPLTLATPLRVPKFDRVAGVVRASRGDLPLVIVGPRGLGSVTLAVADLDQPPFAEWRGRAELVQHLAGSSDAIRLDSTAAAQQRNSFGITDLAGQLRGALDRFAGVEPVPFYGVALAMLGYVALLFPLNWLLVHNGLKRPAWMWLTLPAILIVGAGVAYGVVRVNKGSDLRVSIAEVVDVDVGQNRVHGRLWAGVYSPRAANYKVSLAPQLPDGKTAMSPRVRMAWFGLPGPGVGGMETRSPADLGGQAYRFSPSGDAIEDLPISQWSTRSLTADWQAAGVSPLEAKLSATAGNRAEGLGILEGTITNELDAPLTDILLAWDTFAITIPDLKPGQSISIGAHTEMLQLASKLSRKVLVYDPDRKQHIPRPAVYDVAGHDTLQILRRMMHFDAAGGFGATQLFNRYQHRLDASELLPLGVAVMTARAEGRGSGLKLAGPDVPQAPAERTTYYRFLLPVRLNPHDAGPQATTPAAERSTRPSPLKPVP